MTSMRMMAASALLTTAALATAGPAPAAPIGQPLAIARPGEALTETAHWHGRGWGRGWGWGPGAFASPYYGYGPFLYRFEDDDPPPGFLPPPPEGDIAYCRQHHKFYNPRTGLYRGKGGRLSRCP